MNRIKTDSGKVIKVFYYFILNSLKKKIKVNYIINGLKKVKRRLVLKMIIMLIMIIEEKESLILIIHIMKKVITITIKDLREN